MAPISAPIVTTRSSVLEIDEDLLDEGLAVGSYRLVSQLGSGGMGVQGPVSADRARFRHGTSLESGGRQL